VSTGDLLGSLLHRPGGALDGRRSGTDGAGGVSLDTLHDRRMGPDDLLRRLLGPPDSAGDGPPGFPDDGGRGDGAGGVRVRGGRPLLGLLLERLGNGPLGGVECGDGLRLERGPKVLSGPDAGRNS